MFKKGVITDEISQDLKIALELAAKYNLDGVEIRSVWEKSPHELEKGEVNNVKKMTDDYGLAVCGVSTPFFKCELNVKSEFDKHIEILKKSINNAHKWGTNLIRGFTFWRKGIFEENVDCIIRNFEPVLPILEKEDAILVLESDPSVFATNALRLIQILERVNHPRVRALWDPGNDIFDPEGEQPFPDGYSRIKSYMHHMHLKDAKRSNGEAIVTPLGDGQVDYISHFRQLLIDDYKGYVVLETHYRKLSPLDEALLKMPKGSAFSYKGYEATEESLCKWMKILDRINRF